ncbi:serine-rich adhesin for platelets-like [Palaemon carinicauda]|uniref:serine-rich adhesin for platelets-like n=1 Tax=Palaemon carinicauda TaxID=392227 RepID=UPI0035B60183
MRTERRRLHPAFKILVCGFVLARAAKLPGHLQADTGDHLSGISSEFPSTRQPHTSKNVPEQISIRLLTSALKNVLSSQNDFDASDRSLTLSSDISDDTQHSSENQFEDFTDKDFFSELQFTLPNEDFFVKPDLRGEAPLVTPETSISAENVHNNGQETLSRDQGFLLSNLKTLQPFDQSGSESFGTQSFDHRLLVSQIESSEDDLPNQESSVTSSNDNQFIDSSLESSLLSFPVSSHNQQPTISHLEFLQQQDQQDFESIGTSSPDQHFINSHLELPFVVSSHNQEIPPSHITLSQPHDQTNSESFFTSSHDQQFPVTHLESPQENGDTDAQLFSVPSPDQNIHSSLIVFSEPQHHTDSESFSTSPNGQQFSISHQESSQDTVNADSHLFAVPFHNQDTLTSHIILSQSQDSTDSESFFKSSQEGHVDSESSATLSLDQIFVVPSLESGDRNSEHFSASLPDHQLLFHRSEFSEPLTNHEQDLITVSSPDQQFVVLNPESSDKFDHSFISGSSGPLNLHLGQEEYLPQSKPIINSIASESKSFNDHEHSSSDGQLGSYGQGTENNEQFEQTRADENVGQVSFSSSNPPSFNTDLFSNGDYGTSPTVDVAVTSSNQDSLSQPFQGFDDFGHINQGCPNDQIRHVDGKCATPEISRRIFVIDAPKPAPGAFSKQEIPPPKVEENTIFIRSAETNKRMDPIIVPPPLRKDTIYIIGGKSRSQNQRLIEVAPSPHHRPEVYFLNYNDGQIPALPDGLDLERALSSAIPIEGTVITTNEGQRGTDFGSNSDMSYKGESHTHEATDEISDTGFDVRNHGGIINDPTDILTSGSSSFILGGNIDHSPRGNSNFDGISLPRNEGVNLYHSEIQ